MILEKKKSIFQKLLKEKILYIYEIFFNIKQVNNLIISIFSIFIFRQILDQVSIRNELLFNMFCIIKVTNQYYKFHLSFHKYNQYRYNNFLSTTWKYQVSSEIDTQRQKFHRDYKFICIEGQKRAETSREESDVCTNKEELERNQVNCETS